MPEERTRPARACMPCRRIKTRCMLQTGEARCQRCARKSLDCVFQEHQRGRRPGTRLSKGNATTLSQSPVSYPPHGLTTNNAIASSAAAAVPGPPQTSHSHRQVLDVPAWETGPLQPSGLLDRAMSRGRFTLRNILSTTDSAVPDRGAGPSSSLPSADPVQRGLLSLSAASSLFNSFMANLNPYISQLDPQLHTLAYVRHKSPFLMSAILAVAARVFNPPLHERLLSYAEDLLVDGFRRGRKSTETAQAVVILTYWKTPDDDRAWISLGYAVRMGMELGWHRLTRYTGNSTGGSSMTETQKLEVRNRERTWHVLFVYDRSMSLQTGKPWMIERSDFTESVEAWCRDPLAAPGDSLLGAFVVLRLLTSEVFKLLGDRPSKGGSGRLYPLESLLAVIKGRIEEWEAKWIEAASQESCHRFLIHFYGAHLRLQLFSLPLQEVLSRKEQDLFLNFEAFWTSYSSALEMLRLLCRFSSCVHLAQDSVHVMTAYCVTFLIKIISVPSSITAQIEPEIGDAIRGAARALRQHPVLPGTSCALQAEFLDRIIARYFLKKSEQDHGEPTPVARKEQASHVHQLPSDGGVSLMRDWAVAATSVPGAGVFLDDDFGGLDAIFGEGALWGGAATEAEPVCQEGSFYT
ncbi:Protein priB [Emericellopsis cladophorae]|uniref:Protein priB n=1 Tax=Emericellopsis cladophorae TaxID=2686198 RepID=A0A9Q0B951_9HYPO|nr:Protein priB [Emericellopsis cladophorae]KAI6778307.1 Protein priB [Emericellopsis cladophorae]